MSQGIMHGDLVCKLNDELLRVREELRQAIAALESCGNSPTARLDARAYAKRFRRRLKK